MTQENKELLLKDLCARLPYGVKCVFGVDDAIYEIRGINPTRCGASEIQATHIKSGINGDFTLNACKPYLFPLSSMTKEQYNEWCDLGEKPLDDILSQTQVDVFDSYVNSFLHSKSNEYVVFDGTSKELFCGSLKRCVAWLNENKKHYSIYSREAYNEMLNKINEVTLKLWTIDDAKDGDVLVDKDNNIGIFQKFEGIYWYSYIYLGCDDKLRGFSIGGSHKQTDVHPATKEQCDLLFQKIKENGYKWNNKTKTLEQLVPDKFNINTLKPFDKVLVRDHDGAYWDITFYECYDKTNKSYPYRTLGGTVYKQCIPYKGNEDLAGIVKECSDYYKTWINEENEFN